MQKNNADKKMQTLGLPGLSFVVAGGGLKWGTGGWEIVGYRTRTPG